jgi:hypothetical protein
MVIRLRRMAWAGHVAHTGEMRHEYNIFVENKKRREHLEDFGLGSGIIFK